MAERINVDYLIGKERRKNWNCIGFAFKLAGLTSRYGYISPLTPFEKFDFLQDVQPDDAVFIAATHADGETSQIYHIAYIDPKDRNYVIHGAIGDKEPRRELLNEAMFAYMHNQTLRIRWVGIKGSRRG